jgi:hypothetical protein
MDIYERYEIHNCPHCGGPGLLEEENDWCFYVACLDCGAQTAPFEYKTRKQREEAAGKAVMLWNMGKVIRQENGE